jgi:Mrp family chromosome partitioning ATPase
VSLGFVQQLAVSDAGAVTFDLELTTPACPVKDEFRSQCETLLRALPWVTSVTVNISAKQKIAKTNRNQSCPGLSKTKRIIAVSSAKGGVGKSTVAVNLAFSIAALGGKVGIFDADIFGPSLPTMLAVEDTQMSASEDNAALIAPLQYGGVKLMSQGFTPQGLKGGAASMRGPMVASRVHQLIAFTDWGELDYLIIDMPPGTGDIQLTIAQEVHLDGAVIVTTPQKLSFVDVVRGIDMFDTLSVPVIGLVENMGHFKCGCGQIHRPFGPGHARVLTEEYGTPAAVSLPIDAALSACGDGGRPLVLDESSEIAAIFSQLAAGVVKQISINAATIGALPLVEHQQEGNKEIPSNVYRALSCALFAVR